MKVIQGEVAVYVEFEVDEAIEVADVDAKLRSHWYG